MKTCEFSQECDGLNFSGLIRPQLCPFHQAVNVSLSKDEKINLFHNQRKNRLLKNGNHLIFTFLRDLKLKNKPAFNQILFYFGEMTATEREDCCICWASETKHLYICKEAFRIICPKIKFKTENEFRLEWKKQDMDPIVFDKLIFPDYLFISKHDLDF